MPSRLPESLSVLRRSNQNEVEISALNHLIPVLQLKYENTANKMKTTFITVTIIWSITGFLAWIAQTIQSLDNEAIKSDVPPYSFAQALAYGPAWWILYLFTVIALRVLQMLL